MYVVPVCIHKLLGHPDSSESVLHKTKFPEDSIPR